MSAALRLHRENDPAPPLRADEWEPHLVALLARLDHFRSGLDGLRLGPDAAAVLDRAEGMVHAADDLAGTAALPESLGVQQTEAVGAGGVFLAAAQAARTRLDGRGLWASLIGRTPADLGPEVRTCLLLAADALQAYFTLFTRAFPQPAAARGWVDAASTFLADVRRQARDLAD